LLFNYHTIYGDIKISNNKLATLVDRGSVVYLQLAKNNIRYLNSTEELLFV